MILIFALAPVTSPGALPPRIRLHVARSDVSTFARTSHVARRT